MTDFLSRVRDIALLLPGAQEARDDAATVFTVEGRPFAELQRDGASRLVLSGETSPETLDLSDATDWTLVEDRIARSWELTAPRALLEAGGR